MDSLSNNEAKWGNLKEAIKKDNKAAIAPYLILTHVFNLAAYDELKSYYDMLNPVIHNHRYSKRIEKQLTILDAVSVGNICPEFALNDTSGTEISISSFRGSYVLIDFWASWCGPCRKENPAMIECYNEMKNNRVPFEIIGVAADFDGSRWKKAIVKDQLPWVNVSDIKGFDGKAFQLFGIKSIPYTVVIDTNGRIIEKGMIGEELRNSIKELPKIKTATNR